MTLPSGASLRVEADGSFVYDPRGAFDQLGDGQIATDSFVYEVTDLFGGTDENSVMLTVTGVNDEPQVSIFGAPESSIEGSTVSLSAVVTDLDANDAHDVQWSVTKDGAAFATGSGTSFDFTPDDNAEYSISAVVTDSSDATGNADDSLSVLNQAPTASLQAPDVVIVDDPTLFTLIAMDVSAVDQGADFTFQIDWDGNGVFDQTVVGPSGVSVTRSFSTAGDAQVLVNATDKDGAESSASVVSVEVAVSGNQPGTAVLVGSDLVITGTDDSDLITVVRNSRESEQVKVFINREFAGTFSPTRSIRVTAGAGDDTVRIDRRVTIEAVLDGDDGNDLLIGGGGSDTLRGGTGADYLIAVRQGDMLDGGPGDDLLRAGSGDDIVLGGDGDDRIFGFRGSNRLDGGAGNDFILGGFDGNWIAGGSGDDNLLGGFANDVIRGGDGNDTIRGGGGRDILLGEDGDDTIFGARGRDLLIGGAGSDDLRGGRGEDIVIAGTTNFDENDESLQALLREWSSNQDFEQRVENVQRGQGSLTGSNVRLNGNTLQDDDAEDRLYTDRDADLFFANYLGDGVLDTIFEQQRRRGSPAIIVDIGGPMGSG